MSPADPEHPVLRSAADIPGSLAQRLARPGVAALLGTLVACLSGPNSITREWQAQLAASPPCGVTLEDVDVSTWRQIQGRGFRLCVPPDWRLLRRPSVTRDPYGSGGWRSMDLNFEWTYAPGQAARQCGLNVGAPEVARHQWSERIGTQDVCIMLGVRSVRAYWDDGLLMGGNARDSNGAARLLGVVRTVRLASEIPPPEARVP